MYLKALTSRQRLQVTLNSIRVIRHADDSFFFDDLFSTTLIPRATIFLPARKRDRGSPPFKFRL